MALIIPVFELTLQKLLLGAYDMGCGCAFKIQILIILKIRRSLFGIIGGLMALLI
jgi:hypothetical protein